MRVGGVVATSLTYVNITTLRARTPAGDRRCEGRAGDQPQWPVGDAGRRLHLYQRLSNDTDGDGLPNAWETQFGLDPSVATGVDGAGGDPDEDGVSNADDTPQGRTREGSIKRYLAEGVTNGFFNTRFAIANPQAVEAKVLLTFVDAAGRTTRRSAPVPARSRRTVDAATVAELSGQSFATGLDSDSWS